MTSVKINPLAGALPFAEKGTDRVHAKDEPTEENLGGQNRQDRDEKRRRQGDETPKVEVTDKNVAQAIDQLGGELRAEHTDIQASMEGSGPGLKVVLKDGRGAIIRQMTGDEFLQLRTSVGPHSKGRLLDKKS